MKLYQNTIGLVNVLIFFIREVLITEDDDGILI